MAEAPLRLQLNADIIRQVFHKGDQRLLDSFSNLALDDIVLPGEGLIVSDLRATMTTADNSAIDAYDFMLAFNDGEHDFLGFQGENLKFTGTGKIGDTPFTWEAPVDVFKLEVEMVKDFNEEILKYNENAVMPEVKQFSAKIGDLIFTEGAPTNAEVSLQIQEGIK